MANIFDAIGKAGELWTYGPHAVAEEKRRQEEHGANVEYRKAMADYYRQGGSRGRTQQWTPAQKIQLLNALNAAQMNGLINEDQKNQALREAGFNVSTTTETETIPEDIKEEPTKQGVFSDLKEGAAALQAPGSPGTGPAKYVASAMGVNPMNTKANVGRRALSGITYPPAMDLQARSVNVPPIAVPPTVNTPTAPQVFSGGALGGLTTFSPTAPMTTTLKGPLGTLNNPAQVRMPEEMNALPSGAYFLAPDGELRQKK